MGRHIRHTHPHAQVHRKRERGTERRRERDIYTYICVCTRLVDAFIWPGIYMAGTGGGVSYINKHRTVTKDGRELLIKG